jgi:ATP-binding cassette subfamily B (MDR/TAP) protein 1
MNTETSLAGTTVLSEVTAPDLDHQEEILDQQQRLEDVHIGFLRLYREATWDDIAILAVSALLAIAGGAILPIMTVCIIFSFSANTS